MNGLIGSLVGLVSPDKTVAGERGDGSVRAPLALDCEESEMEMTGWDGGVEMYVP